MHKPVDLLAVRNAKQHVESYAHETSELVARHAEAMDCRNCEAFLQMGIDAFEWLIRADRVIRLSVYREESDFDPEPHQAVSELCTIWQGPVRFAEEWIAIQQKRGYDIANLAEFRNCVEEMTAIVAANADESLDIPDAISHLRNLALQESRDGQTAELF